MATETQKQENEQALRREASELPALLCAFDALLKAAAEYVDYEHDGDPWTEDARAMGEMTLNDMKRDGRLRYYRELVTAAMKDMRIDLGT